jgi:uracil-DNA glycosylase
VKPTVVIALGATGARSILGQSVTISSARRKIHRLVDGRPVLVTIRSSFLLRLRGEVEKEHESKALVADLRRAKRLCAQASL